MLRQQSGALARYLQDYASKQAIPTYEVMAVEMLDGKGTDSASS